MNSPQNVLAFGHFDARERSMLADVASRSALEIHTSADSNDAAAWLEEHEAAALLVDGDVPDWAAFAVERRAESKNTRLPLLIWARAINDLTFAEAFCWGADDVVSRSDAYALVSRLRQLPKDVHANTAPDRGVALIADSDRNRRIITGRVLRNAGYSVTFAVTEEDAKSFVDKEQAALVVSNVALHQEPLRLVEHMRERGNDALFILNCPPRDIRHMRQGFRNLQRATPTDGFAPAENVLFVSNELGRGFGADKRTSPRLLFGTTVMFRGAGRENDDCGYSYNISQNGLYVRTLAPPDDDLVWLELCPPRSERRVRLVGKVAWRRGLSKGEFATVPPGFGVRIVDGAKMDIDFWEDRYRAFADVLGVSISPIGN